MTSYEKIEEWVGNKYRVRVPRITISKELIKMPSHQRIAKERSTAMNAFQRLIAERKAAAHALCSEAKTAKKEKELASKAARFDWRNARPEERAAWTAAKEMRLAKRFAD